MNYGQIIKKAFTITMRYKFLWFLGILASFTSGGGNFNFGSWNTSSFPSSGTDQQDSKSQLNFQTVGRVLGDSTKKIDDKMGQWLADHYLLIIILIIVFLVFIIAIIVISLSAKGGLIASVVSLERHQEASLRSGMRSGFSAFWRILGIDIIIFLIVLLAILLYAIPIILLIFIKSYWMALGLGILLFPIFLFLLVYLGIITMYALRFAVYKQEGSILSLNHAYKLIMLRKKETLIIWLISLALSIGAAIASMLLVFILILPLGGLGWVIYASIGLSSGFIIYAVIAGLLILAVMLLASGIINAYVSCYWTLSFMELEKLSILPPYS